MESAAPPPAPSLADWVTRSVFFAALALLIFSVPNLPSIDLDSSWRMALGYFFQHGLQFGRDVVFTYGPLGFLMGRTYSGLQFNSLLVGQAIQAVIFAVIIFRQAYRLTGYPRLIFFLFFFTVGFSYEDALHQMIVALVGFELIRHSGRDGRMRPAVFGLLLAALALCKFTNLILGAIIVLAVAGHELWLRRPKAAGWLAAWYVGGVVAGWLLCRQNPLNLPAYLFNSWAISQGYQDAMGLPTPPDALWKGLTVLGLVIAYAFIYLAGQPDRPRTVTAVVALGAYIYLNWKHGFVRADGHMIGFYYCVLMAVTGFPTLLDDGPRWRHARRLVLLAAGGMALLGVHTALPGVLRGACGNVQEKLYVNLHAALNWSEFRGYYLERLRVDKIAFDLVNTRAVVRRATLDVLGHEQGVAIYNGFNYHPRPVFQGYSAYTPYLAKLNFDFYASDQAPEYVLFKMHSIDGRFSTFDDSEVLQLLVQRYEYILNEKGFYLWHRKAGPFDGAAIAPRLLRTADVPLGKLVLAGTDATRPLWAVVEVHPNLLGQLRSFFYKPALVKLRIEDNAGNSGDFRMPLPQGRTGFIINPIVQDLISYMRFAGGKPERRLRALAVQVAEQDRDCFLDRAVISLYELPPSTAGLEFFRQAERQRFHMFKSAPVSFFAQTDIAEETLADRRVMVLHAPSEMAFDVPVGAHTVSGSFGFMPGAYTKGGNTNGAEFIIYCTANGSQQILFQRMLDPINIVADRGLQDFRVELPSRPIGRLYLRVNPGPNNNYSWDWTAWTGIEIK